MQADIAALLHFKIQLPRAIPVPVTRQQLDSPFASPNAPGLWLLCAPAGYGKSTLAREWCRHSPGDSGWLSLDSSDNDPLRFFRHLYAAFLLARGLSPEQDALLAQTQSAEAFLPALLQQMSQSPTPLLLVIDDYHHIEEPRIHDQLRQLVQHLPAHVRLVITTRIMPPIGVPALQVKGMAICIEARHLQFSLGESQQFLSHELKLALPPEQSEAVWRKLNGWPGGLKLFCLLQRERSGFALDGQESGESHQALHDYLSEEVFSQLPAAIQPFVLMISVLEWFDEALACQVTEREQAFEEIAFLERNSLFIERVGGDSGQQGSYRFRPVFGDFLRQRLARDPELLRRVHRRACEALLGRHQVVDALRHAEQADAQLRLGEILAEHGAALMQQGYYLLVRNQLQRLPRAVLEHYPILLMMRTRCAIYDYDMEYFSGALAEAEQWMSRLPVGIQKSMGLELDLLRAQLALKCEQWEQADRLSAKALAGLSPEQHRERAIGVAIQGEIRICLGRSAEALTLLGQSLAMAQAQNSHINVIWQLGQLAEAELNLARLTQAQARFEQAEEEAASRHLLQLEVMEYIHRCWVKLALLRNDLPRAKASLARMEAIVAHCEEERWQYPLNTARLHIALREGRLIDGQKSALELERLGLRYQVHCDWRANADMGRIELWGATGRFAELRQWLATQAPLPEPCNHFLQLDGLNRVRAALLLGKYRVALRWLDQLAAASLGRELFLHESHQQLLRVLALQALGRHEAALSLLQELLPRVDESGASGLMMLYGEPLLPLLRELRGKLESPMLAFALQNLGRSSTTRESRAVLVAELPEAAHRLSVTQKEWRVLCAIANGQTNEQIADALFVAHSTVKSHIRRIYRKLQVDNREQAIWRACQLQDEAR